MAYVLFHAFLIDQVTVRLCREIDGPNAKPTEVLPVPLLEIAFDGIQLSARHKSGIAMRFPRVSRIRWDKPAEEADTVETLKALIKSAG